MFRLSTVEAGHNPDALWRAASREPVSVEENGKAIAIVLSPQAYSDLLAHNSARSSTRSRRKSLTTDSNDLFGLDNDVFCNYGP